MICPKCKEKITYVEVTKQQYYTGYLKDDTNKVYDFDADDIDNIGPMTFKCPECLEDITKSVVG